MLLDETGATVAEYSYSAWGEPIFVKDGSGTVLNPITNWLHIANLNPLRYRGYLYDFETGFYYLQSRYYDPVTHRFINADSLASTGQGFIGTNMFVYCLNNPVSGYDPSGCRPIWERDYGNGLIGYTDTGTGTPYIYSQEAEHVKNMSVGLSTVGRAGCGPVATYNAEVSLGNQPNFDDILDYYGVSNTFLFGYAGVLPDKVISYFEEQGYKVIYSDDILSFSAISATADTCIMWYLYYSDSFPGFGGHYIQYDRVNSSYFARNVYTGRNCISFKYPEDFATAGKHFYAICIGIYEP